MRDLAYPLNAAVSPREKILRGAIIATASTSPLAAAAAVADRWLPIAVLATVLIAWASLSLGFVIVCYVVWTLGFLLIEGVDGPLLMGDDNFAIPRPYWPWSRRVKRIRARRRITALEDDLRLPRTYERGY